MKSRFTRFPTGDARSGPLAAPLGWTAPLVLLLIGLVLSLPASVARAQGAGTEGEGTLPSFDGGTGTALVGHITDVLAVLGQATGEGQVQFLALDTDTTAAIVEGNLRVHLDRAELESRDVDVHLVLGDRFANGLAEVAYGAWTSDVFGLPAFSLELPLEVLYGMDQVAPETLRLRALGPDRNVLGLTVRAVDGTLQVQQSIR